MSQILSIPKTYSANDMNSFMYSVKKDKSVWWLMLISSVTLVIGNLDLGWW